MKRAMIAVVLSSLIGLLGACKSGTTTTPPTGGSGGPLTLLLAAASPNSGLAPLSTTFTASISGGTAPFQYAWDFENDGSFDAFISQSFNRSATRQHTYQLRAEDAAAGLTTYEAVLRVRDATGVERTSDPMTITVTNSQSLQIDPNPNLTFAFSDEQDLDGNYLFRDGRPVYFRVAVLGGTTPYTYQWDFDNDGTIDSTVSNPQYVYTNSGVGFRNFLAQLVVVDARGERTGFSFPIAVEGQPLPPGSQQDFEVNLVTNPPVQNGVITVRFDPSAGPGDALPREPMLDLSAGVSSDPSKRGVPPYEYYWDFENDNRIDAQTSSASVPYYDPQRRVMVNPYLHSNEEQTFTLRLLVMDSAGHRQTLLRTLRVLNLEGRPTDSLNVNFNYGPAGGTPQAFAEVAGSSSQLDFTFNFTVSGSTGIYDYQIDVNGDGTGDVPAGSAWTPMTSTQASETITFGPYDHDNDPGTDDVSVWPVPQFYAARLIIRSLDAEGGSQVDRLVLQAPISLVQVGDVDELRVDTNGGSPTIEPGLDARHDHVMVGFANIIPGGANGQSLDSRGVIIAGGAKGTTAVRDVFRIFERFSPPVEPGAREARDGNVVVLDNRAMGPARRGAVGGITTDPNDPQTAVGAQFYMMLGRNATGALFQSQFQDALDPQAAWIDSSAELGPGGPYPLFDAAALVRTPSQLVITGGLNQSSPGANASASSSTFIFAPGGPSPEDDAFGPERSLRVPRYELSTVVIGSQMYAIGGRLASGQSVGVVETLDLATPGSPWQEVASMRDARAGHSVEVIDGRIYVYGGANFGSQTNTKTLVTTAEVYNPQVNTWSYTVPLRTGRATYDGAAARLPGAGSVSGGSAAERRFNTVWYYGGEANVGGLSVETNFLQEFIYFYTVSP